MSESPSSPRSDSSHPFGPERPPPNPTDDRLLKANGSNPGFKISQIRPMDVDESDKKRKRDSDVAKKEKKSKKDKAEKDKKRKSGEADGVSQSAASDSRKSEDASRRKSEGAGGDDAELYDKERKLARQKESEKDKDTERLRELKDKVKEKLREKEQRDEKTEKSEKEKEADRLRELREKVKDKLREKEKPPSEKDRDRRLSGDGRPIDREKDKDRREKDRPREEKREKDDKVKKENEEKEKAHNARPKLTVEQERVRLQKKQLREERRRLRDGDEQSSSDEDEAATAAQKELDEKKEAERKRSERLEKWKLARRMIATEAAADDESVDQGIAITIKQEAIDADADAQLKAAAKKGLKNMKDELEEDDDEEVPAPPPAESKPAAAAPAEDEVDPLDAFMVGIVEQVRKDHAPVISKITQKYGTASTQKTSGFAPSSTPAAPGKAKKVKSKMGDRYYSDDDMRVNEALLEDDDAEGSSDDDGSAAKKAKRKEITAVDHSKMKYAPFRKAFYTEVGEVAKMTPEDVQKRRQELGIKSRGKDCPKPVFEFHQLGLLDSVLTKFKKYGYNKPTSIQAQCIPALMLGRDLIGCAPTGSGKTLAFLLPMLRHIFDQPPLNPGDGPIGMIMAPTRELVKQIFNEAYKFAKCYGLTPVAVHGGAGVAHQIAELKRGAHIVVCTPGRMIDLLSANGGKLTNLRRLTFLVLDEADRMFDMGFEPQITRIIMNIRPDRQTALFSATFPRSVEALAKRMLQSPLEVIVGQRSTVNTDIHQVVEVRTEESKFTRLLEILREWVLRGQIIIFVDRHETATRMDQELKRLGFSCVCLHGGQEQEDRDFTIDDFRNGAIPILIATSVAARGLDVEDVNLVINFSCPNHMEEYIHRVGRTGRAGRTGTAITFISTDEEKYAPDIVDALTRSQAKVSDDLAALANGFKEKIRAGLARAHGSGFGGKGFRFNEQEEMKKQEHRRLEKKSYGIEEDEEEEQAGEAPEETAREAPAGTTPATMQQQAQQAATAAAAAMMSGFPGALPVWIPPAFTPQPTTAAGAAQGTVITLPNGETLVVPIGNAAAAAAGNALALRAQPNDMAQLALAHLVGKLKQQASPVATTPSAAIAKAAQFVAQFNQSLEARRMATSGQEYFAEEVEINDYPQHARWKVTHKEEIRKITEYTGCSVTTKGAYLPPGKVPALGERKLYLLVEGKEAAAVKDTVKEIKKLIEEAVVLNSERGSGRYTI